MKVKKLIIENEDGAERKEYVFGKGAVFLAPKEADCVRRAVGIVLKNGSLAGKAEDEDLGRIDAELEAAGREYRVVAVRTEGEDRFFYTVFGKDGGDGGELFESIRQNGEEEELSRFTLDRKDPFSARFGKYRDTERYYRRGEFGALTGGAGGTDVFRTCLRELIRSFGGKQGNSLLFSLGDGGEVILTKRGRELDRGSLSETERTELEFLCFLALNGFWRKIEEIRDFNHVFHPIFIDDLLLRTSRETNVRDHLGAASALKRQLFVCRAEDDPRGE